MVTTSFTTAITLRDPLAIDLDGDGIETVGLGSNPILFDHDADGIRTGTGWVKGDDAWLVLDRNGNGSIDSGQELFGVDTQLTNPDGTTRNATSGFEALRALDSNGDNVFNAADAQFAAVRLWRDLNQDGQSQATELLTLSNAGIAAIGLTPSGTNTNLGNGNTVTGTATVTRTNGTTTGIDSVALGADTSASNLNLVNNPFYREFTTAVPLTEQALSLPDMGGSGWVRDLREAMSLGTPQASALAATVSAFQAAPTRQEQMALLDQLLLDWAKTNQTQALTAALFTNTWPGGQIDPSAGLTAQLSQALPVLEVFNGQALQNAGSRFVHTTTATNTATGLTTQVYVINNTTVQSQLLQSYDALRESVYGALAVQTRLKPYLDSISLTIDEAGVRFDTAPLAAMLATAQTADPANAITDLVELNRYAHDTLSAVGFDGLAVLSTWVDQLPADSALWGTLSELNVITAASATGTIDNDIYLGRPTGSTFNGGEGHDLAIGGAANDTLSGGAGHDVLRGEGGNDTLNGQSGNDTLDGGAGNDNLQGEAGNNTYLFGRGDGQDTIAYFFDSTAGKLNTLQFKAGVAPGDLVLKQVSTISLNGTDALEVSIAGTADKITIAGYFYQGDPAGRANPVQRFAFADGTTWDIAAINAAFFAGTAGADTLSGTIAADTLHGQAGNDVLSGGSGDDLLYGGDGDDRLIGDAGHDTLDGGAGNDTLEGKTGNNTYLFGRGDGQDTIESFYDPTAGRLNTLQLKAGVAPGDLVITQAGGALQVGIAGTTDQIKINAYFYGNNPGNDYNPVQRLVFADGTVWDTATILAQLGLGTAGNDTIVGTTGADVLNGAAGDDSLSGADGDDALYGGDGADTLNGNLGNDTLDGGAGNDILRGEKGNNTYLFGRGDGQDSIAYFSDSTAGKLNTVQFKAGVAPTDLILRQVSEPGLGGATALEVGIAGTTDKITISGYFYQDNPGHSFNPVQRFVFADDTTWDIAAITAALFAGTAGADSINGTLAADTLHGQAGNDQLSGAGGDDLLYGGEGDDSLNGNAGHDTLDGGAGNDTLRGEKGNNTYLFGRGDGQDTIVDYSDNTAGRLNTLQFKAGVAPGDLVFRQVSNASGPYALEVGIAGTSDKITISRYFYLGSTGNSYNPVQRFAFADGTTWDLAAITAAAFGGTAEADSIAGTNAADTLYGQAGNDVLSGGSGDDTLHGGDGADTLNGDAGHDVLDGGAGNDVLRGEDGNDAILGGEGADALYGGLGNDGLNGGAGNDILYGDTGNDVLDGGAGTDSLYGGAGSDTYLMARGSGADLVQETYSAAGNTDTMLFAAGIASDQLWFRKVGSDLEVSIIGTADKMTVQSYYTSSSYRLEQYQTADGKVLLDSKVQQLVDAMAAFAPPPMGQTTLAADYQTSLMPTIAANWGP